MKWAVIVAGFLAFAGSARAEKVYMVSGNSTGADFIVVDSVRPQPSGELRFWNMLVFPKPLKAAGRGIYYAMFQELVDCTGDAMALLYSAQYSADGTLLTGGPVSRSAEPVIPDSQAQKIELAVCKPETRDPKGTVDVPFRDLVQELRAHPGVYFADGRGTG